MTVTGAQANGIAAAAADARGDHEYAAACFRATIRAATEAQRRGDREHAALLVAAFDRGRNGTNA